LQTEVTSFGHQRTSQIDTAFSGSEAAIFGPISAARSGLAGLGWALTRVAVTRAQSARDQVRNGERPET
jgi:hypothetical protein